MSKQNEELQQKVDAELAGLTSFATNLGSYSPALQSQFRERINATRKRVNNLFEGRASTADTTLDDHDIKAKVDADAKAKAEEVEAQAKANDARRALSPNETKTAPKVPAKK